jgi:hypothetical protein
LTAETRVDCFVVAKKRKFTVKFDWAVIAPLDALLKAHPELPYKSTAEAAQHAIAEFTKQLRRDLTPSSDSHRPPLEDVLKFLEQHYKELRGKEPSQAKKPR